MHGELRARILREVLGRMKQQFRPEAAGQPQALIRWKITADDGRGDDVFETSISGAACRVSEGHSEAEPRTTLVMGPAEFLKLASGNGNPMNMFMMRKLKVAGDVGPASSGEDLHLEAQPPPGTTPPRTRPETGPTADRA